MVVVEVTDQEVTGMKPAKDVLVGSSPQVCFIKTDIRLNVSATEMFSIQV